jgi:hypothetical protein
MSLNTVVIEGKIIVQSPLAIQASTNEGGILISARYATEEESKQIKFRLPRKARLFVNEPWYAHSLFRPRDIRNATVAIFELGGVKYTLAREYVG